MCSPVGGYLSYNRHSCSSFILNFLDKCARIFWKWTFWVNKYVCPPSTRLHYTTLQGVVSIYIPTSSIKSWFPHNLTNTWLSQHLIFPYLMAGKWHLTVVSICISLIISFWQVNFHGFIYTCQIWVSHRFLEKSNASCLNQGKFPQHPANSHHSWKAEVQEGSKKTADLNKESSWTKGPN